MSNPNPRIFLRLVDGVGLESSHVRDKKGEEKVNPKAGDPAPLAHVGVPVPVPVLAGGEVVLTSSTVEIEPQPQPVDDDWLNPDNAVDTERRVFRCARIIPGSRVIETTAPPVVESLLETGHYELCDPPQGEQPRRPRATSRED